MLMSGDEAKEKLIGKTASFNDSIILNNISKTKGLCELIKDAEIDIESEIERGLMYGVVGVLTQPYVEIPEDPKKSITVFVYRDTEIEILDEEKKLHKKLRAI